MAAASLLEAEVVTADGAVRIANACTNPDLFWALKGGGGGSFGVITRVTLKTHDLPPLFGAAFGAIKAIVGRRVQAADRALRRLLSREPVQSDLGREVTFRPGNVLEVTMVFQGIDQDRAAAAWKPFFDWVKDQGADYTLVQPPMFIHVPARSLWDAAFLKQNAPQMVLSDERPGASATNVFWRSNLGEAGWFLHAYQSTWMPAALLADDRRGAGRRAVRRQPPLAHGPALQQGTGRCAGRGGCGGARHRDQSGGDRGLRARHQRGRGAAGLRRHRRPRARSRQGARHDAEHVTAAMGELRKLVPKPGAYVSESDYFEADWQRAFWGANYARLRAVKDKVDPEGLFFVHHGVGSEDWSPDGFTRLAVARWPILGSVPFSSRRMLAWWRAQTSGTISADHQRDRPRHEIPRGDRADQDAEQRGERGVAESAAAISEPQRAGDRRRAGQLSPSMHADRGGHALAALEAEPRREHVAEHRAGRRRRGGHRSPASG